MDVCERHSRLLVSDLAPLVGREDAAERGLSCRRDVGAALGSLAVLTAVWARLGAAVVAHHRVQKEVAELVSLCLAKPLHLDRRPARLRIARVAKNSLNRVCD